MSAPTEYRVVLRRSDNNQQSFAPGFTAIIVANDMSEAVEMAADLARTLTSFDVVSVALDGEPPSTGGPA